MRHDECEYGLLLFVEPRDLPALDPKIDELTRKMTAALRAGEIPSNAHWYRGTHVCTSPGCREVRSTNFDVTLSNGMKANSLAVHYLAYHRKDVTPIMISHVFRLEDGEREPEPIDLMPPAPNHVTGDVIGQFLKVRGWVNEPDMELDDGMWSKAFRPTL